MIKRFESDQRRAWLFIACVLSTTPLTLFGMGLLARSYPKWRLVPYVFWAPYVNYGVLIACAVFVLQRIYWGIIRPWRSRPNGIGWGEFVTQSILCLQAITFAQALIGLHFIKGDAFINFFCESLFFWAITFGLIFPKFLFYWRQPAWPPSDSKH